MHSSATKSEPDPTKTANPVVAGDHFPPWLLAVLLALVTVALYWPAMRCDFINLDDPDYVVANLHVQGGLTWEGIKWAFTNTNQAAYWAPLMWLSHELACQSCLHNSSLGTCLQCYPKPPELSGKSRNKAENQGLRSGGGL